MGYIQTIGLQKVRHDRDRAHKQAWWTHIIIHLSKPTECAIPRVHPNANYEAWMIMMCQYKFISCNKCTTLVDDNDNGDGYAYAGE